jgi:flagella basal body P-ring formation protein FlgA
MTLRRTGALLIVAALPALAPGAARGEDLVILRRVVLVRGDTLRVGDVARVVPESGEGAAIGGRILRTGVSGETGPFPVGREEVEASLAGEGCRVEGADVLVLPGALGPREAISRAVERLVGDRVAPDGVRHVEVVFRSFPKRVEEIPDGTEFRDLTRKTGRFEGALLFTLGLYADGTLVAKHTLSIEVHPYREVVLASRALRYGEVIGREDVRLCARDLLAVRGEPLFDPAEAVGKVAKRSVEADGVILRRDIRDDPLILRGDIVGLLFDNGTIRVRGVGVALESAAAGERIRIRNVDSGRTISGRVNESRRVVVGGE